MNLITVITSCGWSDEMEQKWPQVCTDYGIKSWGDITGQSVADTPTDPNAYVIYAKVDDALLALIEADASYTVLTTEVI